MTDTHAPELDENGFLKNPAETTAPDIPQSPPEPEAAPKKRRGRPPKNPSLITEGVASGEESTSKPTRSKSRKVPFTQTDIAAMGRQLVGIHLLLVQVTGIPEMQISTEEGTALAQSVVNIADQYDLAIDGKTGAAIQLFATAAMIYAPRAFAYRSRMMQQKQGAQNGNIGPTVN